MPELPEVETTCRGIAPHITGKKVKQIIIRNTRLRYPIPESLTNNLTGQTIHQVTRRGKYILLHTDAGVAIIHLGMSGTLRIIESGIDAEKHDHVDIIFDHKKCLRLRDPRRFGCLLWTQTDPQQHKLLKSLGPEPLSDDFNENYIYKLTRKRSVAVKQFVMNSHIVVGVGNIYTSEALFQAGINPTRPVNKISLKSCKKLSTAIKDVLSRAITQGGTTLRDFYNGEGKPGYFQQQLSVYGRESQPCHHCNTPILKIQQGQRATYYCKQCQR